MCASYVKNYSIMFGVGVNWHEVMYVLIFFDFVMENDDVYLFQGLISKYFFLNCMLLCFYYILTSTLVLGMNYFV